MSQGDTFVSIGTPFEVPENDDDFVRKKPVPVHEQVAVDWKGRRRFHGAFTGGFSAGHFNTVGTVEGWAPKSFTSCHEERAGGKYAQRPEDFMDDEDLGEFGIAPRHVATHRDFTHPENQHSAAGREESRRNVLDAHHAVIPGVAPLHDLVIPASQTVGARLLKRMGWREGQGIGPKQQRPLDKSGGGSGHPVQTKGEASNGESAQWAFAPRDVDVSDMPVLVGRHGLGYKGMDAGRTAVLQSKMRANPSSALKITGQAFGVGAYETQDADVYDVDDMASYDQTMGASDHADPFFGWSGSHDQHLDGGDSLSAFAKAKHPNPPRRIFRAPDLPREFKPYHQFKDGPKKSASSMGLVEKSMTSNTRGQLLGEQRLQDMSVLSLLSAEDRERLAKAKQQQPPPAAASGGVEASLASPSGRKTSPQSIPSSVEGAQRLAQSSAVAAAAASVSLASRFSSSSSVSGPGHFKPYASDPDKQQRYEVVASGQDYVRPPNFTEWEEQREREEFGRASQLYRPLGGAMAARFTPATGKDGEPEVQKDTVLAEHVTDPTDQMSAARAKMFGRLTRTTLEWHPDRAVCKRFNIPDPYPNSTFSGLRTEAANKKANFMDMDFARANAPQSTPVLQLEPADEPAPSDAAPKELSSFQPVASADDQQSEARQASAVTFKISSEPMKPRSRPAPSGPLSILNNKSRTHSAEKGATVPSAAVEPVTGEPDQPNKNVVSAKKADVSSRPSTDKVANSSSSPVPQPEQEADTEPERPSMDFFKAIFASDSEEADDSSSSDEDSSAVPANAPAVSAALGEKIPDGQTGAHVSVSGSPPRHSFIPRARAQKVTAVVDDSDSDGDDAFGPALPPAMASTSTGIAGGGMTAAPSHADVQPNKEHRRSGTHKEKKAKKKHKKKEKKTKKSRKTRRHESHTRHYSVSDDSRSSDSEPSVTADRSSCPAPTSDRSDVAPASPVKRPTASDFM